MSLGVGAPVTFSDLQGFIVKPRVKGSTVSRKQESVGYTWPVDKDGGGIRLEMWLEHRAGLS